MNRSVLENELHILKDTLDYIDAIKEEIKAFNTATPDSEPRLSYPLSTQQILLLSFKGTKIKILCKVEEANDLSLSLSRIELRLKLAISRTEKSTKLQKPMNCIERLQQKFCCSLSI